MSVKTINLSLMGGTRAVVSLEAAQEALPRVDTEVADLGDVPVRIDLSENAWKPECLDVFRTTFEKIKDQVVELKINDIIASLDTEVGLESVDFFNLFAGGKVLKKIDLSENALGVRAFEILKPLLTTKTIRELNFYNCGMSKEVCDGLVDILLPIAGHLRLIDLGRNQQGPEGAKRVGMLFASMTNGREIRYAGSRPLKSGTYHLCHGLASSSEFNLQVLDLADCSCGDGSDDKDGVKQLSVALSKSIHLRDLDLFSNALSVGGIELVVNSLKNSEPPLERLILQDNELTPEGAAILAPYILKTPTLTELDLETNELGDEGVEALAEVFGKSKLQKLNLNDNEIGEDGIRKLLDHKIETLEMLSLTGNNFPATCVAEILAVYPFAELDEDLIEEAKEKEAGPDDEVDEMAQALSQANI